jgi:hypothetical protein
MKKIFTLLFITALFCLNTIAQTNDLLKYLPQKAGIIVDIDGASISQKISKEELADLKFIDSLFKKAKAESKEKFVNPSESGLNYHDHFYLIIDKNEGDAGSLTVLGKVTNEVKLSDALQKIHDKEVTRKTVGQNKMMMSKNFVFGWNQSVFVIHAKLPFDKHIPTETKLTPSEKKKELVALEKKCIELLTPKQQVNFTNKDLEAFIQTKADFKMWMDNKNLIREFSQGKQFFGMGLGSFLQPDHKTSVMNFEKGKILSSSSTFYDDSTLAAIKNIYGEKLNADLFKQLPSGNLLGLYAMSFKPEGIKSFIETSGLSKAFKKETEDESLDSVIVQKKKEFDPTIILDNFKGDVIAAVTFAEPVKDDEGESKSPFSNFNIFFAATVKDEARLNKLIDSLKKAIEEKEKKKEIDTLDDGSIEKRSSFFPDIKPAMKVENGTFYLTISRGGSEQISTTNKYDDLYKQYGQNPTLMMFDIKTLMSMLMGFTKKMHYAEGDSEMYFAFEVFDKMIMSGGKFENNAMITTQEVKFTNADENSLKQMLKMFDLIFSSFNKMKTEKIVRDIEIKEN